jgi:hypothetical protein
MKPELNTILSRLFASLIVPGFIASGPYLAVLQDESSHAHRWLFSGGFGATSALVLIVFTVGLLMEEWGDRLEWWFWKRWSFPGETDGGTKREADWFKYLVVSDVSDAMADHIAHVVSRLKWELSGGVAFFVGAIPVLLVFAVESTFSGPKADLKESWLALCLVQVVVGFLLLIAGKSNMNYLVELRKAISKHDADSGGGRNLPGKMTFEKLTVVISKK